MAKASDTRSEAEGADGEEGKAAPAKRKLSLRLIVMVVGGLVGLGAIGGGGYHFLFAGHGKAEAAAVAEAPPVKPVVFLDMPDVLVTTAASARNILK
jgi:flagellar protein FliL